MKPILTNINNLLTIFSFMDFLIDALLKFLIHLILAVAGLLVYSLIQIKSNIFQFKWSLFFHDNRGFWNWAAIIQLIFAIIIAVEPKASEAIKLMTGLDYTEPMAFFMTGTALAKMANVISKDKIGKTNIIKNADSNQPKG